jgi:hypothetical protein
MTDADSGTWVGGVLDWANTFARVTAAMALTLAAPAVSLLPALTAGIDGSGARIRFPHGFTMMIVVTILVTAVACALGALIAGRAGFAPIRFVLAWWGVISVAVAVAGASLDHTRLTQLGIAVLAAAVAGAAVGLPLAARR